MNKVILAGNITMDPTVKQTESGKTVATTSIATNEFYKDANGDKQQATEFHNLVAWGKTAELFENHIRKGAKLLIDGKIKTRSWEGEDGVKKYRTEIIVDKVEFMGGNKKEGLSGDDAEEVFGEETPAKPSRKPESDISIEDIPF